MHQEQEVGGSSPSPATKPFYMKHKIKIVSDSKIYIQIKFDLFKVFDKNNNYLGLTSKIGETIF